MPRIVNTSGINGPSTDFTSVYPTAIVDTSGNLIVPLFSGDVVGVYMPISGGTFTGPISFSSGTYINLDTLAQNPAHQEGRLFYDNTEHTVSYYNDAANVTVNLGQEQLIRVRNNTGSTLLDGTAVNINGAQGDRPTVHKAIANTFVDHTFIGIVTHDILAGDDGYVTANGIVHTVNASSVGISGVSAGSQLYLSPTVSGNLTATRPSYPNFVVPIGFITKVAGNNVDILVSPAAPATLGFDGANTVLGTNAAGTAEEYKTITGVGGISVSYTPGIIQISGSQNMAYFIRPSGAIDGNNKNFTLPTTPIANTVFVYENGIRLTPSGVYTGEWDYVVSGTTITMTIAPVSGSKILVDYGY